jgi:hypothetical protein
MRGEGDTSSRVVTGPDPDRVRLFLLFNATIVVHFVSICSMVSNRIFGVILMQFYCPFAVRWRDLVV